MVSVTPYTNLSVEQLDVRPPKVTATRNKVAAVYYRSTNGDLLLQTCELRYVFPPDQNDCVKLGLDGYDDPKSDQAKLALKIADVEARLQACIDDQASLWLTNAPVEFKSVLYQGNSSYAPTFKLKVSPGLSVFDANRHPIPLADVARNSVVKAIVRLGYVWTSNNHFGATWQLTQLLVVSGPQDADGAFAFVDE
ncbi:g7779 [Coccomyxa elongata]